MVDLLKVLIVSILLGVAFMWMSGPARRQSRGKLRPAGSLGLKWYLDERSHTGDLLFIDSHVGFMLMHPISGEPLLVEADDAGGIQVTPARERLVGLDADELLVFCVVRPLSAARVLNLRLPRAHLNCSQVVAHMLGELGVLRGGDGASTPLGLANAVSRSGKYRGPFVLE